MGAGAGLAERRVADIVRRCYAGLGAAQLQHEVLARLRRIVPVDAAFFATVDPVTLLFTGAVAEDPLGAATPLFLDNEFGQADVNKFAVLAAPGRGAGSGARITSLDRATRGDRAASHRYREIMAPLGLGDEVRAALVAGQHCWGVLCLHREDSPAGFTGQELRVVQQIAPHVAEGLRRAVAAGSGAGGEGAAASRSRRGSSSWTRTWPRCRSAPRPATGWPSWPTCPGSRLGELPVPVYAAAARLARAEQQPDPALLPTVRVRTQGGRWLAVHATRLTGPAGPQTGVVLEPAVTGPAQLAVPERLRAHPGAGPGGRAGPAGVLDPADHRPAAHLREHRAGAPDRGVRQGRRAQPPRARRHPAQRPAPALAGTDPVDGSRARHRSPVRASRAVRAGRGLP